MPHDHEDDSVPHGHLTSVGIDIGSSTSHLMFSQLIIGYPSLHRPRPEILKQNIIGYSPVLLTPFSGDWNIEAEPLRNLFDTAFRSAQIGRGEINTGAVIITGEAARRNNARQITELFSGETGRFVCATAGPRLETLLAAHGSGAVARSREDGSTLLNVDIGGGTTKVSLICRGKIEGTMALNLGARLVAHDESGNLIRLEKSGQRFLDYLGYEMRIGQKIEAKVLDHLATTMANVLFDLLAGRHAPWPEIFVTPPLGSVANAGGIVFSGGVSEYIYGRETAVYGDLGLLLGQAVKQETENKGYLILPSTGGIRATVIGASQYSMQLSGQTIYVPQQEKLPLHNLRIFVVRVDWDPPVADRTEMAIRKTLAEMDPEVRGTPFAVVFSSPPFQGYGAAQELAHGIARVMTALAPGDRPQLLAFEQNIGRFIGETLGSELSIPCVDEISLSELDFIDVGSLVEGQGYVPVVVKSLAFGI